MSSINRYTVSAVALLLCFVVILVTMFRVPNVAPDALVNATIEQVTDSGLIEGVEVQSSDAAPVEDSSIPTEVKAEPVYPTTLAYAKTTDHDFSTLWGIAARECGNGSRWTDIMLLNGLEKPEDLKPGVVKLPVDCTLKGPPIAAPTSAPSNKPSSPALVVKVEPAPAPTVKVVVPVVEPAPELPAEDDLKIMVMFNCSKPRPVEATPGGKYFENWLRQCGDTFFNDISLYDDTQIITTPHASAYQLQQAAQLVRHLDYVYSLMLKNPDHFAHDIEAIKAFYLEFGEDGHCGIRTISKLSYDKAATTLVEIRRIADVYSDEWVADQRFNGAFLPPFWRHVFSYTAPAKPEEPEEKPADALAAGS